MQVERMLLSSDSGSGDQFSRRVTSARREVICRVADGEKLAVVDPLPGCSNEVTMGVTLEVDIFRQEGTAIKAP